MNIPSEVTTCLTQFWKKNGPRLDDQYDWPIPDQLPIKFENKANETLARKTIRLRQTLAREWKTSSHRRRLELESWYVNEWGGVRSNKPETLAQYAQQSLEEIIAQRGMRGVASWSKIMSIRDPDTYAIYDARVAFSLNAVQLLELGKLTLRFPIPPGRNTTLLAASKQLRMHPSFPSAARVLRAEVYMTYLHMLERSCGAGSIEELEMLMFASAETLTQYLPSCDLDLA